MYCASTWTKYSISCTSMPVSSIDLLHKCYKCFKWMFSTTIAVMVGWRGCTVTHKYDPSWILSTYFCPQFNAQQTRRVSFKIPKVPTGHLNVAKCVIICWVSIINTVSEKITSTALIMNQGCVGYGVSCSSAWVKAWWPWMNRKVHMNLCNGIWRIRLMDPVSILCILGSQNWIALFPMCDE